MRKTLKVSLNINAEGTPKVTVSENPASPNGKKVRWEKADDSPNDFKFAGIELNDAYWPDQKILIDKNTIICGNKDVEGDYEYVIKVIHNNKLYFSMYPSPEAEGGKPVIRNQ